MNIPPELVPRLLYVLETAHENAVEIYQDANQKLAGYKPIRIESLRQDAEETGEVLDAIRELRGDHE